MKTDADPEFWKKAKSSIKHPASSIQHQASSIKNMEKKQLEELIAKYNEGLADPSEVKLIEQMIEEGNINLTDLRELHKLDELLAKLETTGPSLDLDDKFYARLGEEKRKLRMGSFSFSWNWSVLMPRLGIAAVVLAIGFVIGLFMNSPLQNKEVHALTQEVSDLKEMMMLSLLEKESATDRLKAVNLTSEMNSVSQKVTSALFQALNQDESVNVRLAALEALKPYVKDSKVREGLIVSISQQTSPLVQVSLAELMASIQEKKSVKELQKILDDKRTPADVKNKIQESIKVLI